MIAEVFAADLHDFRHKGPLRVLGIQELFDRAKLFGDMTRVLLFDPVDEVLEIIAVPLTAEPFHDVDPVTGAVLPVFGKLVIASFPLTEQMGTDEVQVLIIDVDLAGRHLIFHSAVGEFTRD